ncbi:MAG: DUF429 domain-containing protein [Dehalococcoidia bacterium]|nr:DUF429 domain-containing protein [Dehalococcoidia bacterium]
MATFVGLDLAWTPHRESGVCVLEGDDRGLRVATIETVVATPREFAERIAGTGDDVVAAIDAPLVVREGRRAEALLARHFGRYGAYGYVANRPFLERMRGLAGPELGSLLAAAGVSLDPTEIGRNASGRFAFEMYPHAAQVVLFGLRRILRYKRGRLDARRSELELYRTCLAQLVDASPIAAPGPLQELLWTPLDGATGRELKQVEDRLDALTCALAAFEAWQHGIAASEVFGSADAGSIAVPGMARDERFA